MGILIATPASASEGMNSSFDNDAFPPSALSRGPLLHSGRVSCRDVDFEPLVFRQTVGCGGDAWESEHHPLCPQWSGADR